MERKIEKIILEWKNSSRRMPLIIKGARQIGKTYTALMIGKKYYKNTVYFNMEDSQEIVNIFEKDFDYFPTLFSHCPYSRARKKSSYIWSLWSFP